MSSIRELNSIVSDIVMAATAEVQLEAGKKLLAYTVREDVSPEFRELAENIAMLMVQKEGRDVHLLFVENDLHIARHDSVTGLPNRGLFYKALHDALHRSRRKGRELAVLLLDLDRFKSVNDTYGHDAGDELLKQAAERIRDAVSDHDTAARLGGDEFVVLIAEVEDKKAVLGVADRIQEGLRRPFKLQSATVTIDSSVGIGFLDETVSDSRTLLKHADVAMYAAKAAGKGCCRAYDENA